jgi:hypothetical protein
MPRLLLTIVAFNLAVLLLAAALLGFAWSLPQPIPPVATLMIGAAVGGALLSAGLQVLKARFDP